MKHLITFLLLALVSCSKTGVTFNPVPPVTQDTVTTKPIETTPVIAWSHISDMSTLDDGLSNKYHITYDSSGHATHIDMTVLGNDGHFYDLNYNLTYREGSIYFSGNYKSMIEVEDTVNVEETDEQGFSMILKDSNMVTDVVNDNNESLLHFDYDNDRIVGMDVGRYYKFNYDDSGNVISILNEVMSESGVANDGLGYTYDYSQGSGKHLAYNTDINCGSIYYPLIEALEIAPLVPHNFRTSEMDYAADPDNNMSHIINTVTFNNPSYDEYNNMTSYKTDNGLNVKFKYRYKYK